ncbi:unnamed protein product [Closterium sp. NIES-65]|nr:unnamed protein product [Closterium sp. NIES-65]
MTDHGSDRDVSNHDDDVIMAPDPRSPYTQCFPIPLSIPLFSSVPLFALPQLAYILPPSREDQPTPDTTSTSPSSPPYLLLVAPGGFIPALSYLPLIRAIRSTTPPSVRKRLWVAVLNEVTLLDQEKGRMWARDGYEAAVKAVKEMGADVTNAGGTSRVFVLGHSIGAFLMTAVVREKCLALISIGSSHNNLETSFLQFPRPTLNILGDRDGQAPPIAMALAVKELDPGSSGVSSGEFSGNSSGGSSVAAAAPGSATAAALGPLLSIVQKPVVIIKGMNHAQGGNGVVNKQRGDLEASRPIEEVREEIGRLVSAFMLLHLHSDSGWAPLLLAGQEGLRKRMAGAEGARGGVGGDGGEEECVDEAQESAVKVLQGAVEWSLEYLRPVWKALEMEREEPQHVLDIILSHAGLSTSLPSHTIFHAFMPDFLRSKPDLLTSTGGSSQADSSAPTVLQSAWLQSQGKFWPCQPHTLWVKCKSAAAIKEALGLQLAGAGEDTGMMAVAPGATAGAAGEGTPSLGAALSAWAAVAPMEVRHVAAAINEAAIQRALEMVHPFARERYEREGKKVVFGEDKIVPIDEWIKSDVEWLPKEGLKERDAEDDKEGVIGERGVVVVRSPVLITADEILPAELKGRFGGMHYVKVITEARAMQWIMLDALSYPACARCTRSLSEYTVQGQQVATWRPWPCSECQLSDRSAKPLETIKRQTHLFKLKLLLVLPGESHPVSGVAFDKAAQPLIGCTGSQWTAFTRKYPHAACVLSELLCGMACCVQMRDAVRGTGHETRLTRIVPLPLSHSPHSPALPSHSLSHTTEASRVPSPFAQLQLLFGEAEQGGWG